jgi:hypothetical protein
MVLGAPGLDQSIVDASGSDANFKMLPGSTPDDLKMTTSAHIEGKVEAENAPYELRDHGDIECFQSKVLATLNIVLPQWLRRRLSGARPRSAASCNVMDNEHQLCVGVWSSP